ncbi:hypothetical protein IW261DRAFT_1330511 [Armillaria novae-zelandiae]|uniref:Uncharacterized protein n=1 Tax=Armillaria novae-zelandiae TaxID=153914 RepID=A0AA39PHY3_9AGAR|nr:hypothetical protein IW261DRAFT_1330511 [Armillaria novae-zelandiae]
MPSITNKPGVNPWKITYHPVPVHVNQMEMLHTQVNNSARRFQELKDFINDFTISKFSIRLPITLLQKIAMQNLASWAQALLSLQPVTMREAEQLDHMITAKAHDLLGFPFRPLTDVLTLPIAAMGFKFPSITRINLGIAIDGVACDLNHHAPAYKAMAHITLADWTCAINGCINPFDSPGLQHEFSHYYGHIPTTWIVAQKAMMKMPSPLFLHHTDQSHISRCKMSLTHATKICASKGKDSPHGRVWYSLQTHGLSWLHQIGEWDGPLFKVNQVPPFSSQHKADKAALNAWNQMHEVLNNA